MAPPRLGPGERAPEFALPGTGDRVYRLTDYRGQPVVLVFYPGDNSPVCTIQLNSYSADIARFHGLGAEVLAISPQDVESHEQFTAVHQFPFPLLSDSDRSTGRAYGVLGPVGFYRRCVFVVDAEGVIRYAHRASAGLTFRRSDELVAAIEAAQAGEQIS